MFATVVPLCHPLCLASLPPSSPLRVWKEPAASRAAGGNEPSPDLPPQPATNFHGGGCSPTSSPQSMVGGKQDTLHNTGDLVCRSPACSCSSSSSKTLFYSRLHPLLTAAGCCLAPLTLQPSHLPHLKHLQQPQDMLLISWHL